MSLLMIQIICKAESSPTPKPEMDKAEFVPFYAPRSAAGAGHEDVPGSQCCLQHLKTQLAFPRTGRYFSPPCSEHCVLSLQTSSHHWMPNTSPMVMGQCRAELHHAGLSPKRDCHEGTFPGSCKQHTDLFISNRLTAQQRELPEANSKSEG